MPKLNLPRNESSMRVSDLRAAMTSPRPVGHIIGGVRLSDGYIDANSSRTADVDSLT